MSRIKVKNVIFSRAELEEYLIAFHDFPQDIVITGIQKPVNQEAYCITVQSESFPESGDLDVQDTSRKFRLLPREK